MNNPNEPFPRSTPVVIAGKWGKKCKCKKCGREFQLITFKKGVVTHVKGKCREIFVKGLPIQTRALCGCFRNKLEGRRSLPNQTPRYCEECSI